MKKKTSTAILGEEEEKIAAMGQESETKAAKWVIEEHKKAEKEEQEVEEKKREELHDVRHLPKFLTYKQHLAQHLFELVKEERIPKGYFWNVEITDKGIVLHVHTLDFRFNQRRAFKVCGDISFDMNACERFAVWAGDMVYQQVREGGMTSNPPVGGIHYPPA